MGDSRCRQGGFLRSYRSLIQTIGRAARNVSGTVIMYADDVTEAMHKAIDETNRRRDIQIAYNKEHGIDPKPLIKKISDVNDMLAKEDVDTQTLLGTGYRNADKAAIRIWRADLRQERIRQAP